MTANSLCGENSPDPRRCPSCGCYAQGSTEIREGVYWHQQCWLDNLELEHARLRDGIEALDDLLCDLLQTVAIREAKKSPVEVVTRGVIRYLGRAIDMTRDLVPLDKRDLGQAAAE